MRGGRCNVKGGHFSGLAWDATFFSVSKIFFFFSKLLLNSSLHSV